MLAAARLRQCSRRFSGSNLFTIFGDVQAIGPSGLFVWSIEGREVRRAIRRGSKRLVMYAESESEIQWRWTCLEFDVRYAVGKFGGGGFVFLEGGLAKRGVRTNPRTPPGYGPEFSMNSQGFPRRD